MDSKELESRLERLPWKKSKFDAKSLWVPGDEIPIILKEALGQFEGRLYGENFVYYLSRSGSVTKFLLQGKKFSDSAIGAGHDTVKSLVGTKAEEPMSRVRRTAGRCTPGATQALMNRLTLKVI